MLRKESQANEELTEEVLRLEGLLKEERQAKKALKETLEFR